MNKEEFIEENEENETEENDYIYYIENNDSKEYKKILNLLEDDYRDDIDVFLYKYQFGLTQKTLFYMIFLIEDGTFYKYIFKQKNTINICEDCNLIEYNDYVHHEIEYYCTLISNKAKDILIDKLKEKDEECIKLLELKKNLFS